MTAHGPDDVDPVLRDVSPADAMWVKRALGAWDCSDRWSRSWASTPSPAVVSELLWHGVFRQQAIWSGGAAVGLVQLVNADLGNEMAELELLLDPRHVGPVSSRLEEFLDAAFRDFPFRKLCVSGAVDDMCLPDALAAVARTAGQLSEHRRRGPGTYVDIAIHEIWRDDWGGRARTAAGDRTARNSAPSRPDPVMSGHWVRLEPLSTEHIDSLYRMVGSAAMVGRWPGVQLEPQRSTFEPQLWRLATLQYAVVRRDSGAVIGLLQGLNEDVDGRTIGLSVMIDPALWHKGWPLEALGLMVNLLFEVRGFRKVYCQMSESTRRTLGDALTQWMTPEVTFADHERAADGRYEDWHIFALNRRDWGPRLVGRRQASE